MFAANDNCDAVESVINRFSGGDGNMVVYALSGPCDDPTSPANCRYIGITCQGLRARLSAHITEARAKDSDGSFKYKTYRANWIRSVLDSFGRDGIRISPVIVGLPCDRSNKGAGAAEKYLIIAYRAEGAKLTNTTSGGEGVPASDGEKRKTKNNYMREYNASRRIVDDEFIEMQRASNRACAKKRYDNDNNFRADKLARARARRASDPEFREYMREYGKRYRAQKKVERAAA